MGTILIMAGIVLCLTGITALVLAVIFFKKQRTKLMEQIDTEYRED